MPIKQRTHHGKTLVLQSQRQPLPHTWLIPCLESVQCWAKEKSFDYQFLDDEFFDILPQWVLEKTAQQKVVATDLARLKHLQNTLLAGYQRVIWLDADFLIFNPEKFCLPTFTHRPEHYALGREVWVQEQDPSTNKAEKAISRFKTYTKVHNAYLLFEQGNHFLDFYTAHAERLLAKVAGPISPQFIGPKLLTALHNVVQCPVQETAGMLSPWVIRDLLAGGGKGLDLFRQKSPLPLAGANLCSSLSASEVLPNQALDNLVKLLLTRAYI